MGRGRVSFTRAERGLVASAAFLVFSRVFAFSLVLPGFRDFGAHLTESDLLIGIALGAYGLTMAAAQLANGWLSDHVGRRPVLLLGGLLFVAGSAWAAVAGSIGTLIAARLVQGLGGVSSVAMAAVGETVPAERRTSAMALIGIPAGLGFFLGFVLGPVGEGLVGFRGLFWAMAIIGLVATLPLALRGLPEPLPMLAASRRMGLPVLALALAGFTANLGMTAVVFFLPELRHEVLAAILVGALIVMGAASRAADRRAATWQPVVAALGVLAIGAPLFILGGGWTLVTGGLLFFAAHATLSAVLPSQVSRLAGRSGGRGHGVQLVVAYLGSAAGGALAGGLADSPEAAFAVFAGLCAGVALLSIAVAVMARRSETSASAPSPSPPPSP
ncbi:MAG TPA: MFS transporter [Candidatus Thermoplasmatota archaeon]|nr:MFS transporter [Candidatus Thermoplasmatota archaeon]